MDVVDDGDIAAAAAVGGGGSRSCRTSKGNVGMALELSFLFLLLFC